MLYSDFLREKFSNTTQTGTVEGVPPLTLLKSSGKALKDYKIYGNSVQDGIPTPENPIEIQSVGDKTKNIMSISSVIDENRYINSTNGYIVTPSVTGGEWRYTDYIKIEPSTSYYFGEINAPAASAGSAWLDENKNYISGFNATTLRTQNNIMTSPSNAKYIRHSFRVDGAYNNDWRNNVIIAKSDVAVDFEPYGYKIPVKASGKNSGKNIWPHGDIEIKGTPTSSNKFKDVNLPAGTYTLSALVDSTDTDDTTCLIYTTTGMPKSLGKIKKGVDKRTSLTFTLREGATNIGFYTSSLNNLGYNDTATFKDIQIETGSTATDYEPHVEPITTNIYLNEPLRKVGDYADYIDFKNKKVVRNVGEKIFNGSEFWTTTGDESDNYKGFSTRSSDHNIKLGNNVCYCNKFPYSATNQVNTTRISLGAYGLRFIVSTDIIPSKTSAEFKTWLTGNNIDTIYPLEVPVEELVNLPDIFTIVNDCIIDIKSEIKPSNVYIKYFKK